LRPTTILRPFLLAALLLLAAVAARAHQLGKIQVYATFLKDGTYQIDAPLDPSHMTPEDLGGPAGETRYGAVAGLTPAIDHEFGRLLRSFVDGAALAFDGRPVQPAVAIAPPDPDAPADRVTVRLRGDIPGGARTFRWTNAIRIGSYPLVLKNEGDESSAWQWLEAGVASQPFALAKEVVPPTRWELVRRFLQLGFTHVVPQGPDLILFVLGIFLLSQRLQPLLQQVIAFSIAQALTLALCAYGVLRAPPAVVEPLIALSVVGVAAANLLTPRLRPWRIVLVFACGLLLGLGLGRVLSAAPPPRSGLLTALLGFAAGVEGGQLAVIAVAALLVGLPFRNQGWYRRRVVIPASCLIAAVGLYWSVQRALF
jgi:hypothetical protein